MSDRRFKILSLDGGGIRGYLTLLYLKHIEDYLNSKNKKNLPLSRYFHLISGTSTGAIIACLLAEGRYVEEILEIYNSFIPKIFTKKTSFSLFKTKYDSSNLTQAASDLWKDKMLKDLQTDVLIPTVELGNTQIKIFTSQNNPNEKISEVITASASAPSYFSPLLNPKDGFAYIDGGIAANNPSMLSLIHYLTCNKDYKNYHSSIEKKVGNIILLSIGTGKSQNNDYNPLKLKSGGGKLKWAKAIIHLLMENQSDMVELQVEALMKASHNIQSYHRINPILMEEIQLDSTEKINLLKAFARKEDINIDFLESYFT